MQIRPVQQNQTPFGAKLVIQGDVQGIPEKFITKWHNKAQKIGNEKDSIFLIIGGELQKLTMLRKKRQSNIKDIYYFRPNSILSSINGKEKDIDFVSGTKYSREYDAKNLSRQVMKYLNILG